MLTLPDAIVAVLVPSTSIFQDRTWRKAQILLVGTALTPGRRPTGQVLLCFCVTPEPTGVEANRRRQQGGVARGQRGGLPTLRSGRTMSDPRCKPWAAIQPPDRLGQAQVLSARWTKSKRSPPRPHPKQYHLSVSPNRTCGFHRIRLSSGLCLQVRITAPVVDVHVARPACHEGSAFSRRHDLYTLGLFPSAFRVQVAKRADVMDF